MLLHLEDAHIYYEIHGEGKPLLMIHGNWCDHKLMKGCMERIFENTENQELRDFKRIYIDLPGMGNTILRNEISTTDQVFSILKKTVDSLIKEEVYYIASESYGSYLARALVKEDFNRVGGIMMICPVAVPEFEKRDIPKPLIIERDIELYRSLSDNDKRTCDYVLSVQTDKVWKRYLKEVRSGVRKSNITLLKKIKREGYTFSDDIDSLDRPFDKPSLVLLGMQDQSVGFKDPLKLIDNFPRADFIILDGAGHMLQIEKEDEFNFHTERWLSKLI